MQDFKIPDPDAGIEDNHSVLDSLREQVKEVATQTSANFDIPGYDGRLFAKYRVLDPSDLDEIRRKVRAETKDSSTQISNAALDTLIAACDEFWVRIDKEEKPLRQLEGVNYDLPIRYDQVLAETLKFADDLPDPPTARSVVIALFGGNVLAAQAHCAIVSNWMLRTDLGLEQVGGI